MKTLTFSAVDNPEIPVLLLALDLPCKDLQMNEVVGRTQLALDGETGPSVIISFIASQSPSLQSPKDSIESTLQTQWISFALGPVASEIRVTHDFDGVVLGPLHAGLERRAFLTGSSQPSLADWLLFSMLLGRISGITGSRMQKYYRVVRWAGYLSHLLDAKIDPVTRKTLILPKPIDIQGLDKALSGLTLCPVKPAAAEDKKAKAPKKQPAAAAPAPVADHPFARVDLRVGRIIKAERHPAADRLYVETVDLGEESPRTVVSGLVGHVELDSLHDRLAVFICNLKPATLCKTLSSAMLLVSKDEASGVLEPLVVPASAKPGDRISIEGVTPQPDAVIKPKEDTWERVRVLLTVRDGTAQYDGKPLQVAGGSITSTLVPNGQIS